MLLHQKKNHYLRIGLAITAVITAMALVGCFWTPYAPTAMSGSEKFAAPSLRHLFGTDNFGRDIFSRVMVGARTTFFISACPSGLRCPALGERRSSRDIRAAVAISIWAGQVGMQ